MQVERARKVQTYRCPEDSEACPEDSEAEYLWKRDGIRRRRK